MVSGECEDLGFLPGGDSTSAIEDTTSSMLSVRIHSHASDAVYSASSLAPVATLALVRVAPIVRGNV